MGWRVKFVSVLVVYFAGFATAVYWLAPNPDAPTSGKSRASDGFVLPKERILQEINSGMHKIVALGREAAERTGTVIQEKLSEIQAQQEL